MKKSATNQKQKTQEAAFIPSDYIMSSLDIAEAAGIDHEEVQNDLMKFFGKGPIDTGGYISVLPGDELTGFEAEYLLDLQAVIAYTDVLKDVYESPEIGKKILSRFFELAGNPSAFPTDSFYKAWNRISSFELPALRRFHERLFTCAEAASRKHTEA